MMKELEYVSFSQNRNNISLSLNSLSLWLEGVYNVVISFL